MDLTAITLCKENHVPVVVYDLFQVGNTVKACLGEPIGTFISCGEEDVVFGDSGEAKITSMSESDSDGTEE